MAKVIFTIVYEINEEKREEYLALSQEMKAHIAGVRGKNYSIYEQKGKKNNFVEVFLCDSREEYDQLEDDQDEKTETLINRLEDMIVNGKMKYTTLLEMD